MSRSATSEPAIPTVTLPGPGPAARTAAALLFGVLAVVLPLSLLASAGSSQVQPSRLLLALQWSVLTLAALRLAALFAAGARRPLQTLFWSYVYIWLGLAALVQTAAGTNPLATVQPVSVQVRASLIVLLGGLCYEAGRLLAGRSVKREPAAGRPLSRGRALALALFSLAAAPVLVDAARRPARALLQP